METLGSLHQLTHLNLSVYAEPRYGVGLFGLLRVMDPAPVELPFDAAGFVPLLNLNCQLTHLLLNGPLALPESLLPPFLPHFPAFCEVHIASLHDASLPFLAEHLQQHPSLQEIHVNHLEISKKIFTQIFFIEKTVKAKAQNGTILAAFNKTVKVTEWLPAHPVFQHVRINGWTLQSMRASPYLLAPDPSPEAEAALNSTASSSSSSCPSSPPSSLSSSVLEDEEAFVAVGTGVGVGFRPRKSVGQFLQFCLLLSHHSHCSVLVVDTLASGSPSRDEEMDLDNYHCASSSSSSSANSASGNRNHLSSSSSAVVEAGDAGDGEL